MKKKNKKKGAQSVAVIGEGAQKKFDFGMLLLLVLNTAVIFGFYRYMLSTPYFLPVLVIYMVAFAAFLLTYIIYNRGFTRNGVTVDMLPDSMTNEEKVDFIEDAVRRKRKSKWMLTLIFPFVFTFGFDALSWIIPENIISVFKG
ncbi:MAG: hypothetical protein E7671_01775 [Ruminococcaceae bacterium]|nr:hypothetical protein [Oscillospiraceae bacterium]